MKMDLGKNELMVITESLETSKALIKQALQETSGIEAFDGLSFRYEEVCSLIRALTIKQVTFV